MQRVTDSPGVSLVREGLQEDMITMSAARPAVEGRSQKKGTVGGKAQDRRCLLENALHIWRQVLKEFAEAIGPR